MKWDRADFKPGEAAGFQNGDYGALGGFEALRLIRFVFRGVGFIAETEPSAYALGYRLPALRAWGQGLGAMGRCASVVPASVRSGWLDRTGTVSFCVFL